MQAAARDERRLARLTDLLIDGALDTDTYHAKKRTIEQSQRARREELALVPDPELIERQRMAFLELMKNLTRLHEMGDRTEKREIVENAFSNRRVRGKCVELTPSIWLALGQVEPPVLYGAPGRNRTLHVQYTFWLDYFVPHNLTQKLFDSSDQIKKLPTRS